MKMLKSKISLVLVLCLAMSLFACAPNKDADLICEYPDLHCAYYAKTSYIDYKYKDYIADDVSNGMYKLSTPNLADYKLSGAMLDYDIPAFVQAKMDYAIKTEMIKNHEYEIDEICAKVRDDKFRQKNSYIYFYDYDTKKPTLLYDGPVTNLTYDDESPMITFDIYEGGNKKLKDQVKGRRMLLSDILASNTTIDGYMKVILGTGNQKLKFIMDKRVDEYENMLASRSNIDK